MMLKRSPLEIENREEALPIGSRIEYVFQISIPFFFRQCCILLIALLEKLCFVFELLFSDHKVTAYFIH